MEIINIINAYNKNLLEERRSQASICYINSQLIQAAVASLFNKDAKFPSIYETFPNLFTEKEMLDNMQQDWRIAKENMLNYSDMFNKKFDKGD